ncbi:hypothetical protein QEN19_003617 [Hanseniaspora menglaensis]
MSSAIGSIVTSGVLSKLKDKGNRTTVYVYLLTCISFVVSIKLIYSAFDQFLLQRDEQDQQNLYKNGKNSKDTSSYVITKIIYEDPLLMTLIFQISFIILFPLSQVYFFIKYQITPKQQLLNMLKLHKNHGEIVIDSEKNAEISKQRQSLDSKIFYKPSTELNFEELDQNNRRDIASIAEEEQEGSLEGELDISDLMPFPQTSDLNTENMQKNDKILDYKNNINDTLETVTLQPQNSYSTVRDLLTVFLSLKPIESIFFGLGTNAVVFSVFKGISLIPFLDTMIMFNLSSFEILSLLFSCLNYTYLNFTDVCNIRFNKQSNEKDFFQLLKAFSSMIICVAGCFLATSERKATELASTATANFDPFIFNRLGGCLILGLATLLIGPLAILWNSVIMQYLYVLIHSNDNQKKQGSLGLYKIFSNQSLYSSLRGRQNTLSLEMDVMNYTGGTETHQEEVEHEQLLTEKEFEVQFQSMLTFQVSFISTVTFFILLIIKMMMPSTTVVLDLGDDNIISDSSKIVVQTCAIDPKLLSNLLFTFPTFLFGILYLCQKVKIGILISIPMTVVFLSFLIETIWSSGTTGTTLAPGDTFEKGEAMGYITIGLGALWGILVHQ